MGAGEKSPVAVIGAGLVGRGWAISFARAGHQTRLYDTNAAAVDAALAFIDGQLGDLAAHDLLDGQRPEAVRARIARAGTLQASVADAVHVQECAPEDIVAKRALFAELDGAAPAAAVLASSTSALVPSSFAETLAGRGRCLVVHPLNPPYLIPAVEVVPAPWTTAAAVERTAQLMRAAGHTPIVLKNEIDGFVMNRLQGALLEEAFRLVDEGVCSSDEVDIGIRDGLALRWSFMGPFEAIDLNAPAGVRDYVARYQQIYARIFPTTRHRADWAGPVLDTIENERRRRLKAGSLADRQRWRDARLMALLAHKRRASAEIGD